MTRYLLYDPAGLAPNLVHPSAEAGFLPLPCYREEDIKTLLGVGAVDVVALVDATPALVQHVRALAARVPILVLLPADRLAAEIAGLIAAGAFAVLPATLPDDAWHRVLDRLSQQLVLPSTRVLPPPAPPARNPAAGDMGSALATLREFSRLLTYSLNQESLVQHFIARLRELLGVSRVAIYLQKEKSGDLDLAADEASAQRFFCAGSIGLPAGVAQSLALTRLGGLGRLLARDWTVVRASQAPGDARALQELETLGCSYALPVCDLEGVIGVVVLGGAIAQGELCDQELQLAYHLLEQLGQAVQNSRLHARLEAQHCLINHVLDTVNAGVVVFNQACDVVYANATSQRLLSPAGGRLSLAVLPKEVAERVHQAVEYHKFSPAFVLAPAAAPTVAPTAAAPAAPTAASAAASPAAPTAGLAGAPSASGPAPVAPTSPAAPALWLRYSLLPLTVQAAPPAATATMLVVEDHTAARAAEKHAAESATASTISLLAERFAHEVRNSLTAIMAHGQMLDEAFERPDFRQSLKTAIDGEGRRIGRLTQQLLLLAATGESSSPSGDRQSLLEVLRAGFNAARAQVDGAGQLALEAEPGEWWVSGSRARLVHAFSELFLNSLQMDPQVSVRVALRREEGQLRVDLRDTGPGFTPEVAARALEPFYTTRTVGVGLGLTVAANIFNACGGSVKVQPRNGAGSADVVVTLPSYA